MLFWFRRLLQPYPFEKSHASRCPRVPCAVSAWLPEVIVILQSPRHPLCCCRAGWTSTHYIPLIGAQPSTAPMRPGQRLRVNNLPTRISLTHLTPLWLGQFHEAVAARRVTTISRLKRSETPACLSASIGITMLSKHQPMGSSANRGQG